MNSLYVREEVCIGCGLCLVYCQAAHSRSKDIIKAFKRESPRPLSRVHLEKNGETCFPVQCRHCIEPWCVYCCLTGAMQKDPVSGTVYVDSEKCVGCWTCIVACPYGALVKDTDKQVIAKCDLCSGLETPACVSNCPNEALVFSVNGNEEI